MSILDKEQSDYLASIDELRSEVLGQRATLAECDSTIHRLRAEVASEKAAMEIVTRAACDEIAKLQAEVAELREREGQYETAVLSKAGEMFLTLSQEVASLRPWKSAIMDALISLEILQPEHEADPKLALNHVIGWYLQGGQ